MKDVIKLETAREFEIITLDTSECNKTKVYLVETLECDYDTSNVVDGVFETKEKALAHINTEYGFVEEDSRTFGSRLGKTVYHGYGYLGATHKEFVSDEYWYYTEYEEDGVVEKDLVQNMTSITIFEVEVQ